MATVTKEVREVYDEALAIGLAHNKERTRHRNTNEKLMVRAAENVYAAHMLELVTPDGYRPEAAGVAGREEVAEVAAKGEPLTAKGYALLIGFSEAYISRLYRLGHALDAGLVDPDEKPENGPTRWQLLTRSVGDTPEVGKVLGKDASQPATVEALDAAIEKALTRKAAEREEAARVAPSGTGGWLPDRPSEQIGMLEELTEAVHTGRHLTPKQIERVKGVMDALRAVIEEWVATAESGSKAA